MLGGIFLEYPATWMTLRTIAIALLALASVALPLVPLIPVPLIWVCHWWLTKPYPGAR
jgi:hypothetical protein